MGNLDFTEAVGFFKSFSTELNPGDTFLVGIDSTKSKEQVELAYDDRNHTTQAFILNGMDAVSRLLAKSKYTGAANFSKDTFSYVHRFNPQDGCHEVRILSKLRIFA